MQWISGSGSESELQLRPLKCMSACLLVFCLTVWLSDCLTVWLSLAGLYAVCLPVEGDVWRRIYKWQETLLKRNKNLRKTRNMNLRVWESMKRDWNERKKYGREEKWEICVSAAYLIILCALSPSLARWSGYYGHYGSSAWRSVGPSYYGGEIYFYV